MTPTIRDDELHKVAGNFGRLREYFEARAEWTVKASDANALVTLHTALMAVIQIGLPPLMHENAVELPEELDHAPVKQLAERQIDGEKLHKFAAFSEKLVPWFLAQSGRGASDDGRKLLATVYKSLEGTTLAVEQIMDNTGVSYTGLLPEAAAPPAKASAAAEEPRPPEPELAPCDSRLFLEDTEETPMLQEFKGQTELTFAATQAITRFLEEAEVRYDEGRLIRFQRKVLGWIEGTPPDHILVIKVSTLTGRREPYPSYVLKKRDV
jgi:hypothetical protein